MIKVHHLENSRSQRILWLLEELRLDYEVLSYQRGENASAPESLKAIHPLGKSPILTDGELVVAESGAIIEYLLDAYDEESRLRPFIGQDLLDYRYWLHFAEGSLMPLLVMKLVLAKVPDNPMPFFIKPVARTLMAKIQAKFIMPRLTPQLAFIEERLQQKQWFAGSAFSAADIQMSFPLLAARSRLDLSAYPSITSYLNKLEELPSFQLAIEKGGEFRTL
ncbi:glutathione S-transferase family protein [Marinomonas epiphytica]